MRVSSFRLGVPENRLVFLGLHLIVRISTQKLLYEMSLTMTSLSKHQLPKILPIILIEFNKTELFYVISAEKKLSYVLIVRRDNCLSLKIYLNSFHSEWRLSVN